MKRAREHRNNCDARNVGPNVNMKKGGAEIEGFDDLETSAEAAFAAVCAQVEEAKTAQSNAACRAHKEAVSKWTSVLQAAAGKPWKAIEAHEARTQLQRLSMYDPGAVCAASATKSAASQFHMRASQRHGKQAHQLQSSRVGGKQAVGDAVRHRVRFDDTAEASRSHLYSVADEKRGISKLPFDVRDVFTSARHPQQQRLMDGSASASLSASGSLTATAHEHAHRDSMNQGPVRARVLPVGSQSDTRSDARSDTRREKSPGSAYPQPGSSLHSFDADPSRWLQESSYSAAETEEEYPNPLLVDLGSLEAQMEASTTLPSQPSQSSDSQGGVTQSRKRLRASLENEPELELGPERKKESESSSASQKTNLSRLQSELLDALLAANNLPLRFEKRIRGDVCDACPGGVAMTIGANDSLLECPKCGIARKLSQATAATAGGGNDLDFSAHASGKQKSRVVDVLEFTQAVQHKEPKPYVLFVLMEHLWQRAQDSAAARVAFNEELEHNAADFDAFGLPYSFAAEKHTLESHALLLAEEVVERGPFLSAEDAEARLGARLPCLRHHLTSMSYYPMYSALQGAFEIMKKSNAEKNKEKQKDADKNKDKDKEKEKEKEEKGRGKHLQKTGSAAKALAKGFLKDKATAATATANANANGAGSESEGAVEDAVEDADANANAGAKAAEERDRIEVEETAIAGTRIGDLKDVNGSYELAAKIGAMLGGYHGVRMTSQQREQLYVLHGRLHAELERSGARMRLPHRFLHEIRQLCLLRGLHEFLPLYPLPHPIGSPPLLVLEDTLKSAFQNLRWEYTDAQTELSESEMHQAVAAVHESSAADVDGSRQVGQSRGKPNGVSARALRSLGIIATPWKGKQRYFRKAPLPQMRWSRGTPGAHTDIHFEL